MNMLSTCDSALSGMRSQQVHLNNVPVIHEPFKPIFIYLFIYLNPFNLLEEVSSSPVTPSSTKMTFPALFFLSRLASSKSRQLPPAPSLSGRVKEGFSRTPDGVAHVPSLLRVPLRARPEGRSREDLASPWFPRTPAMLPGLGACP